MAALSRVARRVASSTVPIALQCVPRQNHKFHPCLALSNHSLHFSSHASDNSLLKLLQQEIASATESDQHSLVEELPSGFPFKVEDNPGHQSVTLKRKYQDEDIVVEVHMPGLITGGEEEGENEDEDGEKALQSSVPLVVKVSKKGGESSLEFHCVAYVDEIEIESLAVKTINQDSQTQLTYEGPGFHDLDENLQKSFLKYLEIRGIRMSTLSFLHEYMIDKDAKEYLSWLQRVKKFIQA